MNYQENIVIPYDSATDILCEDSIVSYKIQWLRARSRQKKKLSSNPFRGMIFAPEIAHSVPTKRQTLWS